MQESTATVAELTATLTDLTEEQEQISQYIMEI